MSLTKHTYTQSQFLTDDETGTGFQFQDVTISKETVGDGTLRQRFDLKAYPQKGINYDGTDADGNAVPAAAKKVGP